MYPRRICLYGGPGGGKDTIASLIFAHLKKQHINIELVTEYIKSWTYIDRNPTGWDGPYIFGHQQQREFAVLQGGFDYLVTSCPVFINAFYSMRSPTCLVGNELTSMALQFEKCFPGIHIFLQRGKWDYNTVGRFHTQEEALEIDESMQDFLVNRCNLDLMHFVATDTDKILRHVMDVVGE